MIEYYLSYNQICKKQLFIKLCFIVFTVLFFSINTSHANDPSQEIQYAASAYDDADNEWGQEFDRSFAKQWESNPQRGFPTLSKKNIDPMRIAIKRYAEIVAKGGWVKVPDIEMKVGINTPAVKQLRQRLIITGDLSQQSGYAETFDYYVSEAVKKFQKRNGLTTTGVTDKETIRALNVPASARLRQLRTNLVRLKKLVKKNAKKYVLANIPAAQVEAIQDERVVSRHVAIIGKIDRQTPVITSKIHEINFNPYWTLPRSIIRKDLVPQAIKYTEKGKDLLEQSKINVYDKKGQLVPSQSINWNEDVAKKFIFKQDPWKENALGFVKINFHNAHAVFLHDTPSKQLFTENFRADSSGCIRVQNIQQLVSWILEDTGGWNISRIAEVKRVGSREDVKLKQRIPIYIVYVTAWATGDGIAHFRHDVYRKDALSRVAAVN